jgi:hypothetical protein
MQGSVRRRTALRRPRARAPAASDGAFARAPYSTASCSPPGPPQLPLRPARALRRDASLLLPIAPLLDDWGERVARHPELAHEDRAEIVAALVLGCQKVPGQSGYQRGLAGFARAHPRGLDAPELAPHWPVSVRRALREPELARRVAVPRESFEKSLAKRTREILAGRSLTR